LSLIGRIFDDEPAAASPENAPGTCSATIFCAAESPRTGTDRPLPSSSYGAACCAIRKGYPDGQEYWNDPEYGNDPAGEKPDHRCGGERHGISEKGRREAGRREQGQSGAESCGQFRNTQIAAGKDQAGRTGPGKQEAGHVVTESSHHCEDLDPDTSPEGQVTPNGERLPATLLRCSKIRNGPHRTDSRAASLEAASWPRRPDISRAPAPDKACCAAAGRETPVRLERLPLLWNRKQLSLSMTGCILGWRTGAHFTGKCVRTSRGRRRRARP